MHTENIPLLRSYRQPLPRDLYPWESGARIDAMPMLIFGIRSSARTRGDLMNPFVLDRARGFYELALRAEDNTRQLEAAVMSLSFACELVLKGFATEPSHSHDLHALFGTLAAERKTWLTSRYKSQEDRDLAADLTKCGSIFVDFRYYHEKQGFVAPTGLMARLARFFVGAAEAAIAERPDRQFLTYEWIAKHAVD